ncbi:hypothetical protein NUACC21_33790 [Scytonema sp. NUACC21]
MRVTAKAILARLKNLADEIFGRTRNGSVIVNLREFTVVNVVLITYDTKGGLFLFPSVCVRIFYIG